MDDRIRYFLDEHVSHAIAHGLRARGVDVLTVVDAGLLHAPDEQLLQFAEEHSRVIYSQDADYLRLHAQGMPHAGIVYARQQTSVSVAISGLMLIFEAMKSDEMQNHVEFL